MEILKAKLKMEEVQKILKKVKDETKEFNNKIKETGYYLETIHKVKYGNTIYIYIGQYWFKKVNGKNVYIGTEKPAEIKEEMPSISKMKIIIKRNEAIIEKI